MSISNNKFMDNMGGIKKIYPIPTDQIVEFGNIKNSKIGNFKVKSLTALDVDFEQSVFSEPQSESKAGTYYKPELSCFFVKDNIDIHNFSETNRNKKFVVIMVMSNGIMKVAGTKKTPLNIKSEFTPGTIEKLNGYKFKFHGKTVKKALYIDSLPEIVT